MYPRSGIASLIHKDNRNHNNLPHSLHIPFFQNPLAPVLARNSRFVLQLGFGVAGVSAHRLWLDLPRLRLVGYDRQLASNIFHNPDSLKMLVRNFKNEKVGLVDSVMSHTGLDHSGISIQETTYVQRESRIKKMEGMLWGSMMGPSGGFYAIRQHLFHPVPKNFLVDDFYINMKVLEDRYWSICEPLSIVTEDVSNNWIEDFKRKMRISAGNFQNLRIFAYFLLRVFQPVGFCFLSHKVLRWFGPFFLLLALISSAMNYKEAFFMILFYAQIILIIIPIFDHILRKIKIHIVILRFVSHFYNTNLAILLGFFWFLKGIKTNVWQPTKRNQSQ